MSLRSSEVKELDGEEEFEVEQRLLSRFGMSEYYGSEGFDRPPSDVYSSFGGFVFDEGGYFEGGYEDGYYD